MDLNLSTTSTEISTSLFLNASDWKGIDVLVSVKGLRPYLVFSFLCFSSISTVIGNSLVVASIWKEAGLHSPTNYFIASLACADLLVGAVVIPFEAISELLGGKWVFGGVWCDLWRALDVLLATSSILNLSVISLDRYWAISEPFYYPTKMTPLNAFKLILGVWLCSTGISLPAILYWRWTREQPFPSGTCLFTNDPLYLLLSSSISFYLPLIVMLFTYFKIYKAALRQTRSIQLGAKLFYDKELELKLKIRIHRGGIQPPPSPQLSPGPQRPESIEMAPLTPGISSARGRASLVRKKISKFSKEKKASKTLAIVLGVFIICWMPFFIMNVWAGLCPSCELQGMIIFSIFTWLGWMNSAMNPFIYAARNKEFRRAFGKMLCPSKRYRRALSFNLRN